MTTNPTPSPLAPLDEVPLDPVPSTETPPVRPPGESAEPPPLPQDAVLPGPEGQAGTRDANPPAAPARQLKASATAGIPRLFRRLKRHELVRRGDFVADGHKGFKLWEGLSGFTADAFVKTIYRRAKSL